MQEDEAPHTGLTKCPDMCSYVGRTVQVFHTSMHSYTPNATQKQTKGYSSRLKEFAEMGLNSFWEHQTRGWGPSITLLGYVWVSWTLPRFLRELIPSLRALDLKHQEISA